MKVLILVWIKNPTKNIIMMRVRPKESPLWLSIAPHGSYIHEIIFIVFHYIFGYRMHHIRDHSAERFKLFLLVQIRMGLLDAPRIYFFLLVLRQFLFKQVLDFK